MNVSVNKNVLNVTIGETSLKLLTSAVVNIGGGDADTLNGADGAYYLDRDNHTGTQAISTIDGLQNALDLKLDAADYNDRFLGLYASLFDLQAAHPTASAGDYAQVDLGIGTDVIVYAWDVNDAKWAAVGSSAIANTDALPEGSSSLYHTSQRVRDTALSGLSLLSSLAITAADSVLSAFGKLQAQISALATVARTGSYNDLSDRPTIPDQDKALILLAANNKQVTSNTNATIYALEKSVFGGSVPITLSLYSTYIAEIDIILDFPSAQTGNVGAIAFINGATIPLSSEMLMPVSSVNFASIYSVTLFICRLSGNRLSVSGFGYGLNGAIVNYTHASAVYANASAVDFDVCIRFTNSAVSTNKLVVKSARLYKLADPT